VEKRFIRAYRVHRVCSETLIGGGEERRKEGVREKQGVVEW
jgi:hypothetical protein